jgi:hypothetical protein
MPQPWYTREKIKNLIKQVIYQQPVADRQAKLWISFYVDDVVLLLRPTW